MSAPVFATLGCRLNAYETEAMKELSTAAGVENAVIVNTCAVTAEAVRKAKQEIRRLSRENPGATIIVTGAVTPATLLPLLEKHFGDWRPPASRPAAPSWRPFQPMIPGRATAGPSR
jgi:tRNA A37 methylthiotransferase MiaB